jgi:putative inorganic carbon (hco3(-)) transporter
MSDSKILKKQIDKMTWAQVLLIAGLAPFFIFPSVGRTWIFLIVGVWFVIKWVASFRFIKRTVVDWAVFLLLFQVLISTIKTSNWDLNLLKIAGVLYGILIFYAVVELLKSRRQIKVGVGVFVLLGVFLSTIGILGINFADYKINQTILNIIEKFPKLNLNLKGAEEGFNPNALAGSLILVVPILFGIMMYYFKTKSGMRFRGVFFIGATVLFVLETLILILTASRGSWLAMTVTIGFIVWIYFLVPQKKAAWIWQLMSGAVVLLILVYMSVIKAENIEAAAQGLERTYKTRQQIWLVGLRVVGDNPLTGVGMNNVRMEPGVGFELAHVHNHSLHTAAELGIPGLAAYLAILAGLGFMGWKVWRRSRDGWMRAIVLGLWGGQLAHFIWGLGDSIPLGAKTGVFFCLSAALITGIYHFSLKEWEREKTTQEESS